MSGFQTLCVRLWRVGLCAAVALALLAGRAAGAADGCANPSPTLPALSALPAPLQQAPGLGGTGIELGRPGVGGTGIDAGGLGGTGIVGTITGFASVCVNGVEVQFDANTPVQVDGRPAGLDSLAVGKLVAIQASGAGTDYTARSIAVLNTLVGPVERVLAGRGEVQLLGQSVLVQAGQSLAGLRAGQWVQVGGLRRANGQIEASSLQAVAPQAQVRLTGLFERNMGVDVQVSGTAVHLGDTRLPDGVGRGSELSIAGSWDGRTLRAQSLRAEPTQQSLGGVRALVVEGLVHAVDGSRINLGQHNLRLARDLQVQGGELRDVVVNQRVRLTGRVDERHTVHISRIEIRGAAARFGTGGKHSRHGGRDGGRDDDHDDGDSGSGKSGSGSDDRSGRSGGSGSDDSGGSGSGSGSSGSGKSGSSGGSGSGKGR